MERCIGSSAWEKLGRGSEGDGGAQAVAEEEETEGVVAGEEGEERASVVAKKAAIKKRIVNFKRGEKDVIEHYG